MTPLDRVHRHAIALGAALLLGGCSFAADAVFPLLNGGKPDGKAAEPAGTGPAAAVGKPRTVTAAPGTGAYLGEKIGDLRADLARLKESVARHGGQLSTIRGRTRKSTQRYNQTVAAINAGLRNGARRADPALIGRWNAAREDLAHIDNDVAEMNALANQVTGTATLSEFLLVTTRAAYRLGGGAEARRRDLGAIEAEVKQTDGRIGRMLDDIKRGIERQIASLGREHGNLTALSLAIDNGAIDNGKPRDSRLGARTAPAPQSAAPARGADARGAPAKIRRPLVVIRFDRKDVRYRTPLYDAMNRALERRPQAAFDLVAVAPERRTAAETARALDASKRDAAAVVRALTGMGLPMDRLRLSATTSTAATTTEIHIYVR